ncbi:nucleotidyltransferase domain-containing protein [Cyanobacteria bacterium FACHB-63]|nr:nucleotidyltransferase domain-containing protein [Cyanobacteria bacterium FACHB-63]
MTIDSDIPLIQATGLPQIDALLSKIVQHVVLRLGDALLSCYLIGSYAVGEAVTTSDVDLLVVCRGNASSTEKQKIAEIQVECQQFSPLSIDLRPMGETHLLTTGGVRFQADSLLLYGKDIRKSVPQKPVNDHIRDSLYAQIDLFARVRPHLQRLIVPLTYPDSQGLFYGYDRRPLQTADGASYPGIKDLGLIVYGAAYALTLLKANRYAGTGRKSEIALHYREQIGDEWTSLIEAIDQQCRKQWAYLIPHVQSQQQHLRQLCEQTLKFENHFLAEYKAYLLTHLLQADAFIQLRYLQQLERLIYPDQDIFDLLKSLEYSDLDDIREAATSTIRYYQCIDLE